MMTTCFYWEALVLFHARASTSSQVRAARAELRLAVFAPAAETATRVQIALDQLAAAYRAYDLERGNQLAARPLRLADASPEVLCAPAPLGPARRLATLGTRELAGLWHLVQVGDDVPLVERTTARRFRPLPETVAAGARLGLAEDGLGRHVPVHLAPGQGPELLGRAHNLAPHPAAVGGQAPRQPPGAPHVCPEDGA